MALPTGEGSAEKFEGDAEGNECEDCPKLRGMSQKRGVGCRKGKFWEENFINEDLRKPRDGRGSDAR